MDELLGGKEAPVTPQPTHPQGDEVSVKRGPEELRVTADQDGLISRENIIQRAKTWTNPPVPYSTEHYHEGYRTDCSGYVSMAWNLSLSRTTYTLVHICSRNPIGKDDLLPGDVLIKNTTDALRSHVVVFAGWVDANHTAYRGYEQTPPQTRYVDSILYPYFGGDSGYLPFRYDNVIESAPTSPMSLRLALQSSNGQYIEAHDGGGEGVDANRDRIGPDGIFEVLAQPSGRVSLRTNDRKYYLSRVEQREVDAHAIAVTESEVFEIGAFGDSGIGLRAPGGQWLVAVGGGGRELRADGTSNPWAVFEPFGGGIALRASNGMYVTAVNGGGEAVQIDGTTVGEFQTLELLPSGDGHRIALRTANHRNLLRAEGGGGGEVAARGGRFLGWETFQVLPKANGRIALRTIGGYFLSAERGGGARLLATSNNIGQDELFDLVTVPGRDPSGPVWAPPIPVKLALQASSGHYVCAEFGGNNERVNANRNRIGPWEKFKVVAQPSGRVALQTDTGHYLVAPGGGGGPLTSLAASVGPWDRYEDPPPTIFEIGAYGDYGLAFKTSDRQHFVVAVGGGGRELRADGTSNPWTVFEPFGAEVALRARNGQYVTVLDGGGGAVLVNGPVLGSLQILELLPSGDGHRVMLRTANHRNVLRAVHSGGGVVDASGQGRFLGWESFQVVPQGGNRIALRTIRGYYVTAVDGGGSALLATSDDIGPNEIFELASVIGKSPSGPVWAPPIPVKLALQASSGHYVCAEFGGNNERVNANRNRIGPWEKFKVVAQPSGRVALQTDTGHYLVAPGGGGGPLTSLAASVGPWDRYEDPPPTIFEIGAYGDYGLAFKTSDRQHFVVAVGGGGRELRADGTSNPWAVFEPFGASVALRARTGQYVTAINGGEGVVLVDGTEPGEWQILELLPSGDGHRVMLRTANHRNVLRAVHSGGGVVDASGQGRFLGWESFQVVPQGGNRIALRTIRGYYVTAVDGGGSALLATSDDIGPNEIFELELMQDPQNIAAHLLVDAERNDGMVPAPRTWRWGPSGSGAVVLVNNDADGSAQSPDNDNDMIEAGNDPSEVSSLAIEVAGNPGPDIQIELIVSEAGRIRIFDSGLAGAREIIGPSAGDRHTFLPESAGRIDLGMEGVQYADGGFNGEVTISLSLRNTAFGTSSTSSTVVRAAPWIIPNHLNRAEAVFVVDAGGFNSRFRTDLEALVTAADCSLISTPSEGDIWMQDCMEFGYATTGVTGLRTVLRSAQNRPLASFPRSLLKANLGYVEQGDATTFLTYNSTGNLDAMPPVTSAAGKHYPHGRIYFSRGTEAEPFDPQVSGFLRAQVVQDPIELDLTWLTVGHVDEVISIVPATNDKEFVLLLASPRVGYRILDAVSASNPTARLLIERRFPTESVGDFDVEQTVKDFLTLPDDFHPDLRLFNPIHTARSLRQYNEERQVDIDALRARLMLELGLARDDVVEIPSVFMPNPVTPATTDALIPGMVNMLVLNGHCIIPKPFGPVVGGVDLFEKDVHEKLEPLGVVVSFLDCWNYHVNLGEVHCATNTLRLYPNARWWRFQP